MCPNEQRIRTIVDDFVCDMHTYIPKDKVCNDVADCPVDPFTKKAADENPYLCKKDGKILNIMLFALLSVEGF